MTIEGSDINVDMRVRLGTLEFRNPVVTASGTFASGREYADFVDLSRLGAVVTKGVSLNAWPGNPSPRIAETASGMLNSIGLQNPGVEAFCEKDLPWLAQYDVPVIVNVSGHSVAEYVAVAARLEQDLTVDALEVNISCPNVDEGGMAFGTTCVAAAEVTRAVRAVTVKPLIVKLSPNVTDITEIARAVEAEGADAVSLINTLLGMAIDTDTWRPKLARGVGGLSGPAIKPVAVRMVWQVASAVSIPIIGMGGIMTAEDAVEFMLAGASAVAVGTGNFVDPTTTMRVVDGLEAYCRGRGISAVKDLIGAVKF
ncbi:MAG: dihydroorotate dehydrogenase [Actinomycetota bacterium]|nr:MAG: dihydroorotate dehydrogenase [Actinomycetota bacterium]MDO8949686.1 dihydroorotate dehydrogenase [Actinomycetota bacterium]MDP3631468.1 dihydroorotate dehydrogenase [Actinomycetota bacterium]